MKKLIAISLVLTAGTFPATVALKPICPECGFYDKVVVAEAVSSELGLSVYVCLKHGIYFIRDAKYVSHVWYSEGDIPTIKADYVRLEAERTAAREEKTSRLKAAGWSDDTINRVLRKQIRIGDSPEVVREAWGPPDGTYQEDTAAGTAEIWVYSYFPNSNRVRFENGEVHEYRYYNVHRD